MLIKFRKPCDPDPEDMIQPALIYVFNADKQIFEQKNNYKEPLLITILLM